MTDKPDTIAIDNARYAAAQIDAIAHHIDRLITTIEAWFDFRPDPQITDLLEMLSAAALAAQPAITNAAARARVDLAYLTGEMQRPAEAVTRHRDAITGQYVTADEAGNRPDTTIRETRKA